MVARFLSLVILIVATLQAGVGGAQAARITPALIPERTVVAPGTTTTIAIVMRPQPGWHGYWRNPGQAGFGPRLTWQAPAALRFGAPAFPVPRVLKVADLVNHVFKGEHALLVPVTVAADAHGPMRVTLNGEWLACTDAICVPERATVDTILTVAATPSAPDARFDGWRAALPQPLGAPATAERDAGQVRIAIPFPAATPLTDAHFFADQPTMADPGAAQTITRDGDRVVVTLTGGAGLPSGVLAIGEGRGLTIAPVAGRVAPVTPPWGAALAAIGAAILGGLILNAMPCVFPILSLKALSLARSGTGAGHARREAVGYTIGAVAVTTALGLAILALRAGGASVGWAFQLQDARVILVLFVLMSVIALNLAGLFELPSFGGGAGGERGAVATGALAAFVATPCTGPFMGAALGAALVLPPVAAVGVFAGLGLGLALPFLVIGFSPAIRARLPRPGPWMDTLRRVLSVPMFLTALALAWLLGRQAGSDALTIGLAAILVAGLALGWAGARQRGGRGGVGLAALTALVATGVAAAVIPAAAPASVARSGASEAFSEARLAALRGEGHAVFVYFTADWCLTCKVNERVAIAPAANDLATAKVATLVGDWTRNDPAITRFLAAQGRSGVPLYLWYPANGGAPDVLPQVLTPAMLRDRAQRR